MSSGVLRAIDDLIKTNIVFHNLNKRVESKLGLSLVQYQCLSRVQTQPGISSQSLARELGIHPSSLTQTIKRLNKRGLIYVGEHPHDSRKNMLSLTQGGHDAIHRFESRIHDYLPPSLN